MFRPALYAASLALLLLAPAVYAASDTPIGTWTTIDDDTGQAKSIVKIEKVGDTLQGTVIKVLHSDQGEHPVCKDCEGERHNQPVEGMIILWDMQRDGDQWQSGQILDPSNGKTYKCKMSMLDDGQKLKVRGYIGFSLLGRNQVWERVQEPAVEQQAAPATSAATPMNENNQESSE